MHDYMTDRTDGNRVCASWSRWSCELKHNENVASAIVREYLAIAFQEMGLRAAARRQAPTVFADGGLRGGA
jgi:hypothetical protein